jgi:hypothetical protein
MTPIGKRRNAAPTGSIACSGRKHSTVYTQVFLDNIDALVELTYEGDRCGE